MNKTILTQGAEGVVYKAKWLGKDVILKERFSKKYRHPDLDKHITKERMKAEARSLARCLAIGLHVPTLYDADLENGILIIEYISESVTVRNYLYDVLNKDTFSSENVLSLARKIGHTLGRLHENNIIHGDLTSSNMLLTMPFEKSDVILIDFGLSYVDERSEHKAVDLYVLERAILATHMNSELFVENILAEYAKNTCQDSKSVIEKLDEVRQRGRKKLCFG